MEKVFFSIIIPVYNVEKYLCQCIDSVLNQNYKNFEIILIDDGSKDNSGKICDDYAKKDTRIKVYHKENEGLSAARNDGLKKANGEYILFIDSDDFIFENVLEKISKVCENENADIIFLKGFKYFDENNIIELDQDIKFEKTLEKEEIIEYLTRLSKFPGSACTKTYNKNFLIENNLFFIKGLVSEDIEWIIRVLKSFNKAYFLNTPYYYYRQNRDGSITNKVFSKNINSMLEIINKHATRLPKNKTEESINHFLAYEYTILLANYKSLSKDEKSKVNQNVYDLKWLLKYRNNSKVKLAYIFKNIFGIKFTSKLLNMVLEYKKAKNV